MVVKIMASRGGRDHKSMDKVKLTVFTPAYNRGYILDRLYASLKSQTVHEFEWLVIDDGSTDNTQELFQKWTEENHPFSIRYYKVPNGGKHRAINRGVELAQGALFFIVDSDDYITEDAVETILKWERELPQNPPYPFAGVAGARGYTKEKMIGRGHGKDYVDCSAQERAFYGIIGDKAEVFYTDILKQFPFPSFEGENFLTESVVWFAIGSKGYKLRWYDRIIYIGAYLEDGLTANNMQLFYRNPRGYLLSLKSDLDHLPLNKKQRLGHYAVYAKVGRQLGMSSREIRSQLQISAVTLTIACFLKWGKDCLKRFNPSASFAAL